ncbi:hypothetical protein [Streptomyces rubrogriseus]|uniref:Uncharacterized protein n=1 Tax=Streptomyces rubrogriseus TaxID=194673 RepID=A0A6G3TFI5_9ACTN|nr:hypothetical protein [Streptomyces rubrogriseus]NEC35509.1 hypothetical protein [Streptomyces rubrogriseus]
MSNILREAGPEYLAGLLVLATGALTGALVRALRRRTGARRQADHPRSDG